MNNRENDEMEIDLKEICCLLLDRIGIMMESMSALGYTDVVPVYYDNVLKNKTSRDVDSCEMLDIILAGLTYDVGLNFQIGTSAGTFMSSCIVNKQDYASSVAKNTKSMTKMYDKFYNTVLELDSAN